MRPFWQRLSGLIINEIYVTRHRMEITVDTLFFPMINVVLFGYITIFIGAGEGSNGAFFIVGVLLWELLLIMQYNTTVSSMWSIWSHNLTNIFIAPISVGEYLLAQTIAAGARTLIIMVLLAIGAAVVFDFNILSVGLTNLLLFGINLLWFGTSLGIALLGIIFRFGVRLQAVSWGAIYLFQPLIGVFFPVSVLPDALQKISYSLPATYVFEAARNALSDKSVNWRYALLAVGLNLLYFVLSIMIFRTLFRRSKEIGQFARNDL